MLLQAERRLIRLLATTLVVVLAGCASSGGRKAPVEDRSVAAKPSAAPSAPEAAPVPLPGAENAGKPGYYTVKPGDTLLRVSLDHGLNWRDLVRWNNLENPNLLEVGQVLRVVPPAAETVTARAVPNAGRVDTRPLEARPAASAPATSASATAPAATPAPPPPPSPPPAVDSAAAAREGGEEIVWMWPAAGAVIAGFDEGRNKGLTITGNAAGRKQFELQDCPHQEDLLVAVAAIEELCPSLYNDPTDWALLSDPIGNRDRLLSLLADEDEPPEDPTERAAYDALNARRHDALCHVVSNHQAVDDFTWPPPASYRELVLRLSTDFDA